MPGQSPEIANEFIRLAKENGKTPLTQMQLQKLVYIAHGWTLALTNEPLTDDMPRAWRYGPVYQDLRDALLEYGSEKITKKIKNADYGEGKIFSGFNELEDKNYRKSAKANLSKIEKSIVSKVYEDYGEFPAFKLSALTHQDGTPWSKIHDNGNGQSNIIPNELIKQHFKELMGEDVSA